MNKFMQINILQDIDFQKNLTFFMAQHLNSRKNTTGFTNKKSIWSVTVVAFPKNLADTIKISFLITPGEFWSLFVSFSNFW